RPDGDWRHAVWRALRRAEAAYRALWLLNLLLFLRTGAYPTPLERALRMRMVDTAGGPLSGGGGGGGGGNSGGGGSRAINYHFLNRHLLWDSFTKMLLFLAPLIDWGAARRQEEGESAAEGEEGEESEADDAGGKEDSTESGRPAACGACGRAPASMPYATDCGHVFCYFCLRAACARDPNYACAICGAHFAASRRWVVPR
ncbi:unnamed protein product, partial [Phaeothamnion confervicola]